jgi:hypothetical protein
MREIQRIIQSSEFDIWEFDASGMATACIVSLLEVRAQPASES